MPASPEFPAEAPALVVIFELEAAPRVVWMGDEAQHRRLCDWLVHSDAREVVDRVLSDLAELGPRRP